MSHGGDPLTTRTAEIASEIAASCRALAVDLVVGSAGNVSARVDDNHMLVTPSGIHMADVEPDDLVLVDIASGKPVYGGTPTSELALHCTILRARPDVGAVVHTHSPMAAAFGVARVDVPFVCNENLYIRASKIRVTPYATAGSPALAQRCLDTFEIEDASRAVILANHGPVTLGDSVPEATETAMMVEWIADVYHRALTIGKPVILTPRQQSELAANYGAPGFELAN